MSMKPDLPLPHKNEHYTSSYNFLLFWVLRTMAEKHKLRFALQLWAERNVLCRLKVSLENNNGLNQSKHGIWMCSMAIKMTIRQNRKIGLT